VTAKAPAEPPPPAVEPAPPAAAPATAPLAWRLATDEPARAPAAAPAAAASLEPLAPVAAAATVAPPASPTPSVRRSLYDRLGGEPGIRTLVDRFVLTIATDGRVTSNPLVKRRMKKVSIATLRQHFIDYLSETTGGPKVYRGRDMKSSHEGLGISGAEWKAGIQDLVKAMDGCGIPDAEQRELLALIRPIRGDVVEMP
jgi:hemoglobin